jgi:transaldolase/glucose-6-phosphate isomerase
MGSEIETAGIVGLGASEPQVMARLAEWSEAGLGRRIWEKDYTVWASRHLPEITDRLGWLDLPKTMAGELADLKAFAEEIRSEGFTQVMLLGMGGSSLAPEVFQNTFGNAPGYPELVVLDSTHPEKIRMMESRVSPETTLFVVSSKSGTTLETMSLFKYFYGQISSRTDSPGRYFVAVTDPGTPLEKLAGERGFRHVFRAAPDVGGRYSALSVFGLVPAALIGTDLDALFSGAAEMAETCGPAVPEEDNPALILGAALGELALAGRDKVTFITSPSVSTLPWWIEQLIAESTGKNGKGIIPVVGEPRGETGDYSQDRVFVRISLAGENAEDSFLEKMTEAGHPVIDLNIAGPPALGAEIFRWEMAVAAAGAVLGIHPFNQPDVQLAKDLARKAMAGDNLGAEEAEEATIRVIESDNLIRAVDELLGNVAPGDYFALQAYLPTSPETREHLQAIRLALMKRFKTATSLDFGPRFLHSTGQLHKGGPASGIYIQLVDTRFDDIQVPETDYTFGRIIAAQSLGDYHALLQRGRRALSIDLGTDSGFGFVALASVLA